MDKSKLTKAVIALLAIGGLGFLIYKLTKGSSTTSKDPDKNNRNIIITKQ